MGAFAAVAGGNVAGTTDPALAGCVTVAGFATFANSAALAVVALAGFAFPPLLAAAFARRFASGFEGLVLVMRFVFVLLMSIQVGA